MHTCTFEIFLDNSWVTCGTLTIADAAKAHASQCWFDYDLDYTFGEGNPGISVRMPVSAQTSTFPHWLAFLFDLIPQGRGRKYLLGELSLLEEAASDWPLLCAGAFNPIGRLRIKEAVDYYQQRSQHKNPRLLAGGFSLDDISQRSDDFIEHLEMHGMLSAGTPGVQGVAPKFLLTLGKDGLWYADGALKDHLAAAHYLVKLPRGKDASDRKILKNEAAFMAVARALGLFVHVLPEFKNDMLFIPRFDRRVENNKVQRFHQESAASLVNQIGFDQRPSQYKVIAAIRKHVSHAYRDSIEFIKRDILNLAMGNTDNHARNTAIQIVDGNTQLTPLFDFAPMNLDKEGIPRALKWIDENKREHTAWQDILPGVFTVTELPQAIQELSAFGTRLQELENIMRQCGVDEDIISLRHHACQNQIRQLTALSMQAIQTISSSKQNG